MRTQLELWKIVQENFDRYFYDGLCYVIACLYFISKIDYVEEISLLNELKLNKKNNRAYFLGKKGDKQPRIDFINKMIELHSKDQ